MGETVGNIDLFGRTLLLVGLAAMIALLSDRIGARLRIPTPAIFLVGAAAASDLVPGLGDLAIVSVEQIVTVALTLILFDGGMGIGVRRLRMALAPVLTVGVVGTLLTAVAVAGLAHVLFGLSLTLSLLLGTALAPTDPAVVFSVLGNREVGGRAGVILEGESGANDPVGIALMIGMIELATHSDASFWIVVREFAVEMAVGLAVGVAGGLLIVQVIRRVSFPSAGLYTLRGLAGAAIVYGVAAVAHGSGFLAVFVAGLLVGDVRAPYRDEIGIFQEALSSLAEIVVFGVLGLTISLSSLDVGVWGDGLLLAAVVALVVRPLVVGPLLAPARLRHGERVFVIWGGLKGAVPILLAAFAVQRGIPSAGRIYELVFVVVLASVLVQGTTIPLAARRLGVRMHRLVPRAEPEPQS